MRVKCLAQEHRLDPETSALTMRSPSHIKPEFRNLQVSGTFDASSTDISSTDISSTDISEPVLHSSLSSLKFFQGQSEIIKFSDFTIRHKYSLYVAAILATRFLNSFLALNQIFENYMYKHNQ